MLQGYTNLLTIHGWRNIVGPVTTDINHLQEVRRQFEIDFDAAVKKAEAYLGMADVPDDEEAQHDAYDERFHCEVCIVREVMGIVWDAAVGYIETLENALGMTSGSDR